jgi:hypothetical protein
MTIIDSFGKLHSEMASFRRDNRWMYRGHASDTWPLVPKAGRSPYNCRDDLVTLGAWSRRAAEFMPALPSNVWERMALAQHHGLPTRLLDWSYNPLVAAYFACIEEPQSDGALYCFRPTSSIDPLTTTPEKLKRVKKYRPVVVASRIARQSGFFTAHPDPELPLEASMAKNDDIAIFSISAKYKRDLVFELNHYGVNHLTLMGDLDGLSCHIRWTLENNSFWSSAAASGIGGG